MSTDLDLGWLDPSLGALQRQDSGMGSGLSRAVAARMGVDVVLVRVAFALLALSGGLGIALYAWGTALTRGASGVRPIDALLPSFARWSPLAQKAVVILTSLAAVSLISSMTPLPWGPGVILLALFVLARRGRLGGMWPPPTPSQPGRGVAPATDEQLVARWRSEMQAAAGAPRGPEPLPVVDLYSPDPPPSADAAPRPRAAWVTGAGILAAMLAAGAAAFVFLGGPMLALGAALVAGGALSVVHALATRSRRVPRPLLGLLIVGMIAAGWLAPSAAAPTSPLPADPAVLVVSAVGEERVMDLVDADLTGVEHIRIEAVASDLTVRLPGAPESLTSSESLSDVSMNFADTAEPLDVTVTVDATLSRVTLEETP